MLFLPKRLIFSLFPLAGFSGGCVLEGYQMLGNNALTCSQGSRLARRFGVFAWTLCRLELFAFEHNFWKGDRPGHDLEQKYFYEHFSLETRLTGCFTRFGCHLWLEPHNHNQKCLNFRQARRESIITYFVKINETVFVIVKKSSISGSLRCTLCCCSSSPLYIHMKALQTFRKDETEHFTPNGVWCAPVLLESTTVGSCRKLYNHTDRSANPSQSRSSLMQSQIYLPDRWIRF